MKYLKMVDSVENNTYLCINCGNKVGSLFRKYSPTVLKLTNCEKCHRIADKYVEYDVIILIIDLILLQQKAYRHILFNSNYKVKVLQGIQRYNFQIKFSEFMEIISYYLTSGHIYRLYILRHVFWFEKVQIDFDYNSFEFYKIGIKNASRTLLFVVIVYLHTVLYYKIANKPIITFQEVWKMLAISSFGTFLHLPVLIWDVGDHQEIHKFIIVVYIILSQLTAHMVLVNGSQIWSIYIILISYIFQTVIFDYYYTYIAGTILDGKIMPGSSRILIK
ncbi:hypothetical protein HHI36_011755 [Cryptolaemus montrouzieri]|uniref:Protein ARV n=1 Tax=Cryptolaemus montrouzieri TaxID=559131 RepID=A0ABD2NDW5_9CUCU